MYNFQAKKCAYAPENNIFPAPITNLISTVWVLIKISSHTVVKNIQKCVRISNFLLLLVVFKWHHGSEVVKVTFKQHYTKTFLLTCENNSKQEHSLFDTLLFSIASTVLRKNTYQLSISKTAEFFSSSPKYVLNSFYHNFKAVFHKC